nr:hypothetical protein CFP56_35348 [Quercus suber]
MGQFNALETFQAWTAVSASMNQLGFFQNVVTPLKGFGYIVGLATGVIHNDWNLQEDTKTLQFLQLIYFGYSCAQGWFITPCLSDPSLRVAI